MSLPINLQGKIRVFARKSFRSFFRANCFPVGMFTLVVCSTTKSLARIAFFINSSRSGMVTGGFISGASMPSSRHRNLVTLLSIVTSTDSVSPSYTSTTFTGRVLSTVPPPPIAPLIGIVLQRKIFHCIKRGGFEIRPRRRVHWIPHLFYFCSFLYSTPVVHKYASLPIRCKHNNTSAMCFMFVHFQTSTKITTNWPVIADLVQIISSRWQPFYRAHCNILRWPFLYHISTSPFVSRTAICSCPLWYFRMAIYIRVNIGPFVPRTVICSCPLQ